jgi:transposase
MYSVDGPPTAYEFPSVQCGATADLELLASAPAGPSPIAYGGYDADTLDALMLFHTPQSPVYPHHSGAAYFPLSIVDKKREQARFRQGRDDATRRAMHRLVQRRFVKRKKVRGQCPTYKSPSSDLTLSSVGNPRRNSNSCSATRGSWSSATGRCCCGPKSTPCGKSGSGLRTRSKPKVPPSNRTSTTRRKKHRADMTLAKRKILVHGGPTRRDSSSLI